jgi:CDP-diacylglycerol pyrophosphatase
MAGALMKRRYGWIWAIALGALLTAAPALAQKGSHSKQQPKESPIDPTKPAGRTALRQTVQTLCVTNWQQHQNPAPCERVFLPDSKTLNSGYAVIADEGGGAHYLLVPTQTLTDLSSGELLDPDTPNYFAQAWIARDVLSKFTGHAVPRNAVGLAMGIARFSAQDQFHIHIECLRPEIAKALRVSAADMTDTWSPLVLEGSTYQAMRLMSEDLSATNPFELLATLKSDARHHMVDYTLVVAGMQFKSGPGFVVLTGTGPSGELLLESTCGGSGT